MLNCKYSLLRNAGEGWDGGKLMRKNPGFAVSPIAALTLLLLAVSAFAQPYPSRLNREIVAVLAMPDVQKLLLAEGGELSPSTPAEFAGFL